MNGSGIYVSGNYAYIYNLYGDSQIKIMNISNPANPTPAGAYNIPVQSAYATGNYIYVANADSLNIIDISNPLSPISIGSTDITGLGGYNDRIFVSGNYAYILSNGSGGLQIIKLTD